MFFFKYFRHDIYSLEKVSSTDMKCLWNQRKGVVEEMYEAKPVETFCCVRSVQKERDEYEKIVKDNPEILAELEQLFMEALPGSAFGRY